MVYDHADNEDQVKEDQDDETSRLSAVKLLSIQSAPEPTMLRDVSGNT